MELERNIFQKLEEYLQIHYIDPGIVKECNMKCFFSLPDECFVEKSKVRKLDDVVEQLGETFQEKLLRMIDEKGLVDVEVYKKANINRKLFSKIRCNKNYKPRKRTAFSLILAMELNLDEAKDLLARAGYAFSPSDKTDLILQFFIEEKIYDLYTINLALYEHGEQTLSE